MKAILAIILIFMIAGSSSFEIAVANWEPPTLPEIVIEKDGSIKLQTGYIEKEGNTYFLNNNITGKFCIDIFCSNIVFDGRGYTIDAGISEDDTYGLFYGLKANNVSNVIIKNLVVKGFDIGLFLYSFDYSKIYNVTLINSKWQGINERNSKFSQIIDCDINYNSVGIFLGSNANNNIITNCTLNYDSNIIQVMNSQNNFFTFNTFANSLKALSFTYKNNTEEYVAPYTLPINNSFSQNDFLNNSKIIADNGYYYPNSFSINGKGNYWSDYSTNYPNASEIDSSGIVNTPYFLSANIVDEHPLVKQVNTAIDFSPTPNPNSISPSPSVPEFPMSTIMLLMITTVACALVIRRRILVISR